MTVYRVRLYGEVILTVTSEYHLQRMEHLASQTEAARSAASEYSKQCTVFRSRKSELGVRLRIWLIREHISYLPENQVLNECKYFSQLPVLL
jgi:hypothetical protein